NATQLTSSNTCNLTSGTFSGTLKDGGVPSCAPGASQDVWYKFTATDVTMSVYIDGSQYLNPGFEIYQGGCNGTLVTCKNDYNADGYSESYFNNNFIVGQQYYIRVFNASGTLTTRSFSICVQNFPNQANDLCANATQLTSSNTCNLTSGTFSGTLKDGGVPSCAPGASQDVWYKFTATDVTMSVYIEASQYLNPGFEIYQGGCNGTLVTCKNDYNADGYSESYFNNNFIVGQQYYIRVFNASGTLTTRSFSICVQNFPNQANDLCANATQLTPAATCTYVTGTFSGTLLDGGAPSCGTSASQDVWYKFTATAATMSVSLNGAQYLNHGLEIRQGSCTGTVVTCKNDLPDGYSESYTGNSFIIGQEYYVRVFNASSTLQTRSFGICLQGPPPAACTPSVAIGASTTSICQGQSVTFTAVAANGGTTPSYQWKVGTTNVGTNSPTFTTTTLGNGNVVSVVMTSNASCASVITATSNTIAINVTTPVVPAFTQIAAICPGGSFTLPTTSTNGVTGTWSPAVNNNATTTYTFTPTAGQCAITATMTVSVNNNITPLFTQIAAICPGGSFILPTTSTNGVTGTWNPAVNNNATTTYTFTPIAGQCASAATMTVTVNGNIIPTFTQVPAICSGGNFTLPSTSLNGITGTWSPAANNTATTTYTFTPTAGQCASTAMMTVVVNSNATPAFTQVAAICSGGSFTLPATSNNGITGTWSPAINNAATTTYIFTPNAGQCAISASMTVVVNNNVTPTFTQIAPICQGGTFTLPTTSNNGINGTWSPAVNNTATTTYVFMPNAGECAVFTTMTVNVTNGVTPTFTQVPAICQGGTFTLPTVSNNGITGTWSPAVNNNTTTTYTFTPNAGQCASTATMTVSVNNNVTPSFTQIAAICPGGSFTLPTVSNNGITGTWSPAVNNNTTTTYTFTPNPGQCASTATMTVAVNNVNAGVTVTGAMITATLSGASYQWINCNDGQQIDGATAPSFTATANGSYAVIVTHNGCQATSQCITITDLGNETFEHKGWKVYPNPVIEQLFIETDDAADIVITDMTGKTVGIQTLVPGTNVVNTASLSAGMYFITSANRAHVKFIKR
ncbi:MAG: T9SS type A sorting domain-containing protein, partial [Flavobacterium sp.]|uniref:T9SS type A sorting domain-containing protein n=1 Tax=Flavobacterium sp. TaxID=239 RepID=UPI0040347EE6